MADSGDCSPTDAAERIPRVLAVDDDENTRALLANLFDEAGIAVRTFASAAELLDSGDLRSPAVLLLDILMPVVSGLELQRLLRERRVTLPVIFLTGASSVSLVVSAMRNGAVDFIEKPVDRDTLVARVRLAYESYVDRGLPFAGGTTRDFQARLASLTPREREVLRLMVTGRTSKMMARELGGSFRTIEIHRSRVMIKMGAASVADLVRRVAEGGA
jgi:FixJ family two-component response regulator